MANEMVKQESPWDVSNIQEFLYYNCPECDTKERDSEAFIQHALDNHELSKAYLNKPVLVKLEAQNQDDIISHYETIDLEETKLSQDGLKASDMKVVRIRLHKIKVESNVVLRDPDPKKRKVEYDQDTDYEPGSDIDSDVDIPAAEEENEVKAEEDDMKPDESFFCELCDRFFNSTQGLNQHITAKHIPKADRLNEQCDMCGLKCTGYQALKKHEVDHHFEAVQCDTCDHKCHSKRMLKIHMQKHRRIECPQCDAAYTRPGSLANHAKEKHFNSVSCHKCDYKCHSKIMLEDHWKTFHKLRYRFVADNEGNFTCKVCILKTQNEEEMKYHQWEHQDIKWAYKCEICEATFSRKSLYEKHKDVVHMGILPYKCDECDLNFKKIDQLRSHRRKVHEPPPTHICTVCGKSVLYLKEHIKKMHPEKEDEGGTCEQCGMFFEKKHLLMQHKHRFHTRKFQVCTICEKFFVGNKKQKLIDHYTDEHAVFCNKNTIYVCDICKTKVTSAKELSEHYHAVHESKDEFQCSKCDHKEPTRALLSIHCIDMHEMNPFNESELVNEKTVQAIQVHEDDKAYQCTLCSKKLASKVTLNQHMKQMHDKSNHVKCDLCPRTFIFPSQLKKHILMQHTARTKFPCNQCSYVTNRKVDLDRHFRRVHEKNYRLKCDVCEKPIEDLYNLQRHMLKAHDILYKY